MIRPEGCASYQLHLLDVARNPSPWALHRIPTVGHPPRRILLAVVVLADVGAIHAHERPAPTGALHAAKHVDRWGAPEGPRELVPHFVHATFPRLGQHHGILGRRAD